MTERTRLIPRLYTILCLQLRLCLQSYALFCIFKKCSQKQFSQTRPKHNLVTVPERFEASITTLQNTKDLYEITLVELLSALQAQEQRRLMREEKTIEGELAAKHEDKCEVSRPSETKGKNGNRKKSYPPCQHCGKKGHPPFRCWRRPNAKCSKCNQLGHEAVICKIREQQKGEEAKAVVQEEEDFLFVATFFTSMNRTNCWLIDSGFSNHVTHNKSLFKEWCKTTSSKVRVGDGKHITVKGKCTIAIPTCHGTKLISDALYVPDID